LFRSLDVSQSDGRFLDFVHNKWWSYEVQGEGLFVLKGKLKKLNSDMKIWNREVFGNVNCAGEVLHKKIQELDNRDDESSLDESERLEKKILLVEQSRIFLNQEAVLQQKARFKWLKQGDLNTKFFHSTVKWRRVRNVINGILENGVWSEDK